CRARLTLRRQLTATIYHHRRKDLRARSTSTLPNPNLLGQRASCHPKVAEHCADYDRRRWVRCTVYLRWGYSEACARSHRREWAAVPELPLDFTVLADACSSHHGAQPPLDRLRRDLRDCDGIPRMQQRDRQRAVAILQQDAADRGVVFADVVAPQPK